MRCLCSIMHPHASAHVHISHGGEDGDSMHSRGGSITHAEQCTSSDTERGGHQTPCSTTAQRWRPTNGNTAYADRPANQWLANAQRPSPGPHGHGLCALAPDRASSGGGAVSPVMGDPRRGPEPRPGPRGLMTWDRVPRLEGRSCGGRACFPAAVSLFLGRE